MAWPTDPFLLFVKIPAAIGGALVGYFVSGPVVRLLYRTAFHRPIPGWLLPLGKLGGGALLGAVLFFLVGLGGMGLGFGLGRGNGPGDGAAVKGSDQGKHTKGASEPAREKLEIELLGGTHVTSDGRYYVLDKEPKAKSLAEVEAALNDRADKVEVHLIESDASVAKNHPARKALIGMLERRHIALVLPAE